MTKNVRNKNMLGCHDFRASMSAKTGSLVPNNNMAGFSNVKFLAPSHFTKPEENKSEITPKSNAKTVLVPPSTYQKVERSPEVKYSEKKSLENVVYLERKNSELKETIEKLLQEKRDSCYAKEQSTQERKRTERSLQSELQLAKQKIRDVEQEKEMLQYELQDRENLSEVVLRLRKELKRTKEKLVTKENVMKESAEDYSLTVKHLRKDLKTAEITRLAEASTLKETCTKQNKEIRYLEEQNDQLRKQLEAKGLEYEDLSFRKEQERKLIVGEFEKQLIGQRIADSKLERLEGEIERIEEDKKMMKENCERTTKEKKQVEEDFKRIEEDYREIKQLNERLGEELSESKVKCTKLEDDVSLKVALINELQDNIKTNQEEIKRMENIYKSEISSLKSEYTLNVSKVEGIIQSKDELLHQEQGKYKENLQQKEDEIKELVKSVEQLRSYIGEVRPSQEAEMLSKTNRQLTNTVQCLTEENNMLHSNVRLLNVRLSSMLEIVAIQERELTRNVNLIECPRDSQGLLTKWREKVFALMVQLRCQEIAEHDQERKENAKCRDLSTRIKELERENSVLTHKLADKEAALELQINVKRTASEEIEKLKVESSCLKKQQNLWLVQAENLVHLAQAVEVTFLHSLSNLSKAFKKISSLDQRIKFAASRIHFLSEFLVHCESKVKSNSQVHENTSPEPVKDSPQNDQEYHLKEEVEKLLKERAVLLSETRKHNEILKEKTSLITLEYESITEEKNRQIEKLENSEYEMKEKVRHLQDSLEAKHQELEEAMEDISELKLSLNKQKMALEKAHREAFEEERLRNIEDMTGLERQLNAVRREHVKAVAALKDAEKQVRREKEQATKMVSNIERELNEKLSRCQKQLKNVEKERNLLMVRIKEDKKNNERRRPLSGGQSQAQTNKTPVLGTTDTGMVNQQQPLRQSNVTVESKTPGNLAEQQNIHPIDPNEALTALKDLKVLTQQIVKMHGDSNENSVSDAEL